MLYEIEIDFNSEEAIYMQLCHQIILGIAMQQLREGDSLPSVRSLAEEIGINMHTVNKAYRILREEGYVQLDRRKGAVVSLSPDKIEALAVLERELHVSLARAFCKNITKEEVIALVEKIYEEYKD